MVTALVVLVRAERTRGPKYMWALIILLGNLLGSIAFFIFGRRSD
ncbi:PLDc N-terminal domain-containing protein [Cohnella lubricantis]|uniref:PLDc N-terminal domain-containing protein n=2 Tax=Cohnella lubricantis TaxID=2163172 RepID=A0A841TEP3_9BACL|nr:PLDc N-terminal domain-containing protein [Cohnella lubricantis]